MNATLPRHGLPVLCSLVLLAGCVPSCSQPNLGRPTPTQPATKADGPLIERETVGGHKRLRVRARVCLRELGEIGLECLLCLSQHKEYESILATDADPEEILDGLKAVGAAPGSPPKYNFLATDKGGRADVSLRYRQSDKVVPVATGWTVPPDTALRLTVEYVKDDETLTVPVTGEAPAGTRLRAWLEYSDGQKDVKLPAVRFQAPEGPPITVGVELKQDSKVTIIPSLYEPAHGTPVKVTLQYEDNGKLRTVPAGSWVRNVSTRKDLDSDFVFAGSVTFPSPDGPGAPPVLAAKGEGAIISVCDVPTTLLSLPFWSPKGRQDRAFEPFTQRIPPVGHPVIVILEPILDRK